MVMSAVGFTVLYSDTVRIVLLPGCLNYLTTTYKANNSHRPALHTLLSLIREENIPGLVPITPRRSQKHGHPCSSRDGTNVTVGVGTFLFVSLIQHFAFAKTVLCCLG